MKVIQWIFFTARSVFPDCHVTFIFDQWLPSLINVQGCIFRWRISSMAVRNLDRISSELVQNLYVLCGISSTLDWVTLHWHLSLTPSDSPVTEISSAGMMDRNRSVTWGPELPVDPVASSSFAFCLYLLIITRADRNTNKEVVISHACAFFADDIPDVAPMHRTIGTKFANIELNFRVRQ